MRSDHKRNGGSEGKTSSAERKKPLAVPLTTGNCSRKLSVVSCQWGVHSSKLGIVLIVVCKALPSSNRPS
jgi:hypothetical protein